jgi:hypothetical protein
MHILKASFGVGDNAPNCCHQPIKFDRFSVELVAPCRERLLALASERMANSAMTGMSRVCGSPFYSHEQSCIATAAQLKRE